MFSIFTDPLFPFVFEICNFALRLTISGRAYLFYVSKTVNTKTYKFRSYVALIVMNQEVSALKLTMC